jgi:hypothetical protein
MERELKVVNLSEREDYDRCLSYSVRVSANGIDKVEKSAVDRAFTDVCCLNNRFLYATDN